MGKRDKMRALLTCAVLLNLGASGCGAPHVETAETVPPFEMRPIAWMLLLDEYPEMGNAGPEAKNKGLARALSAFHKVVNDRQQERTSKQKVERRRACAKGWQFLTQQMTASRELKGQVLVARTYLAVECEFPQKSFRSLRQFVKTHKQIDFLHYASHFWYGESLLALERYDSAITQYRWILGEPDSSLYPLALLRTAHCHWDRGNREDARSFLFHVRDWTEGKSSPIWIRSLRRQVLEDIQGFSE